MRVFVLLWTLLAALPLCAQTLSPLPEHESYAFNRPRVLTQQRLFGLAHAISLLAATCVRESGYREALMPAYMEWRERQETTIEASHHDLARYYFGDHAAEADDLDIARALRLRNRLDLRPGSKELHAACDSFVEALQKPRYDLRQVYLLQALASRLASATAIQIRVAACHAGLPESKAAALEAALVQWRAAYGVRIDEARATLEQQWPAAQLEGTLDEWLAEMQKKGKQAAEKNGMDNAFCETLPQWLLTRQADPDDEFSSIH